MHRGAYVRPEWRSGCLQQDTAAPRGTLQITDQWDWPGNLLCTLMCGCWCCYQHVVSSNNNRMEWEGRALDAMCNNRDAGAHAGFHASIHASAKMNRSPNESWRDGVEGTREKRKRRGDGRASRVFGTEIETLQRAPRCLKWIVGR